MNAKTIRNFNAVCDSMGGLFVWKRLADLSQIRTHLFHVQRAPAAMRHPSFRLTSLEDNVPVFTPWLTYIDPENHQF